MEIPCVDMETLADIVSGNIEKSEREKLMTHMKRCSDCFERVNSALLVFSNGELEAAPPLLEDKIKTTLKKICHRLARPAIPLSSRIPKFIEWSHDICPQSPMAYGFARNAALDAHHPKTEYLHDEKQFGNIKAILQFEKYNNRFSLHIRIDTSSLGIKNIRFNLSSEEGQVSRLLKEGYVSFEDFPFGRYVLTALYRQNELGIHHFSIDEKGLANGQSAVS